MLISSASHMVIIFFLCATSFFLGTSQEETRNASTILCNRKDQDLLSMFKQGIKDPSNLLSSWSIEEDCCNWKGVQCDNITGRVTWLSLYCDGSDSSKCLRGEINFSVFQLEFLSLLDLSSNDFETIHYGSHKYPLEDASSPTNFSNLLHLNLALNVNLHMDNLIWLSHFSSLISLDLSGINLSNETLWLQRTALLPALMLLQLSGCGLRGINPSLGYVNFTSLSLLDLSQNHFDSEMPKWLFNLSSKISYLDLSSNYLRGQIPVGMLNFPLLEYLVLKSNNLSGSVPEWIGQFKNLKMLDLSSNLLSGPIPATIGNLSSLTSLGFHSNHLNGSLPTTLGKLSRLESLDLRYNSLSGNLSEKSFTKLTSLKTLSLDSSAFIFNFATNWQPDFQLEIITMSNCKLGPEFPSWLYTQRSISYLDISSSGLSFNVQDKFWRFVSQIGYLILSNNSISGDISTALITTRIIDLSSNNFTGRLPRLSPAVDYFNIGKNRFLGPIYPLLCQNVTGEQNLKVLDMSHNILSGELPNCWLHWKSLNHVNLESNYLSGKIPITMGLLVKLETLRLRHNYLFGNLPSSLKSCEHLWFIDLAFNQFTGNIPRWIKPLNMALLLRSNKFSGSIPSQICQLSNLLVLDLANNTLSGPIPKCLSNLTTMVSNTLNKTLFDEYNYRYRIVALPTGLPLLVKGLNLDYWNSFEYVRIIDLSINNLSGSIPYELFSLTALQSLNLSHNQLMGNMPSNIGQMKFLESLDLSGNLLIGEIPQSMSNLSFLSRLNLSYNNFNGRIPLSTQLQSFEASSYIGNPTLCGPPLEKNCAQEKKPNDLMKVSKDDNFQSSFKIGVGVGFSSVFCGIFGTLLFIKEWRLVYFCFLDSLYFFIVVKINHFRYDGH